MKKNIKENVVRNKIIKLLRNEPRTVTTLQKELNVAFGTLSYHLKILRDENLVGFKKLEKQQGMPTKYFLKNREKELENLNTIVDIEKYFDNEKNKTEIEILKMLESGNKNYHKLIEHFDKEGEWKGDDAANFILNKNKKMVELTAHITPKGKQFLKDNS